MIEKNIEMLQQTDLSFLDHSTIHDLSGCPTCYLNLLVEEASGKILDITSESRVKSQEGATSIPLMVKNPFDNAQFELAYPDEAPDEIKEIIEKSLEGFNRLRKKNKGLLY